MRVKVFEEKEKDLENEFLLPYFFMFFYFCATMLRFFPCLK
jgi:hypothetical protein